MYLPNLANDLCPSVWYLYDPDLAAGNIWYDLMRKQNAGYTDAVFTSRSAFTWSSVSPTGGRGSVALGNYEMTLDISPTIPAAFANLFNDFSVSLVINIGTGPSGGGYIIDHHQISSNTGWRVGFGGIGYSPFFQLNSLAVFASPVSAGVWRHYVWVISRSTNKAYIYQNGTPILQSDISAVAGQSLANSFGLSLFSGSSGYANALAIHSHALSAAEVTKLYTESLNAYPSMLLQQSAKKYFQMWGSEYNEVGSGGALGSGSATINVIYSPASSGGGLSGGTDVTSASYNPTASGGATTNGSSSQDNFDNITASGGALGGSEAVITATYQSIAIGGATTNGSYIGGYLYPQVASGGIITNGTVRPVYQQFFVQVASCAHGQKCGFSDDDQFCADELLVQSYGSKFVGVRRRNPSAYQLDPKKSANGSAAMVPAITLCRQKIRLRPQDQKPHRIISR